MDTDKLSNFIQGITDAIAGAVSSSTRFAGYCEGVDAAQEADFDPADYDAEDLFARYFG
jgi:hypothetical protein